MNENEFAELAAGKALNALSDADEQRYADALSAHPEWAAIAAGDAETAAMLADATSPVAPPAGIRDMLLAQIATTPQQTFEPSRPELVVSDAAEAAAEDALPAPRRWSRVMFTLAASVVLLVGIGFGAVYLSSQLAPPASIVALEQIESASDAQQATVKLESGVLATAHWSESVGNAVLVTEGLETLSTEQSYQLWFVRGDEPVPAGLFNTDAGSATALLDGPMHEGDVIAVTVEEAGGSPTGLPTTDPIIAIPTA
ncbi:anti-sigma factor [Microbacterium sp. A93]|uniref:anti-sigma factor n=1 Tax=Microbacterium sp. A93 TaxID=3450716 RepID=UPI003F424FCA